VVSDSLDVTATASDNVGVAGVQFTLDGAPLGAEDTTAPYVVRWDISTSAPGSHTLAAVARDAAGNRTTAASLAITTSDGVTDGVGTDQAVLALRLFSSTTSNGWCQGAHRASGSAVVPSLTYENRLTHLTYWRASISLDVCVDAAKHDVLALGHAVVTPLYVLPLFWSYDNSPHWSFGPVGSGVKSTWAQVTDGFTGCPWRLPVGCRHVNFTTRFSIGGTGMYSYTTRFN
jgi:hypothetical protein